MEMITLTGRAKMTEEREAPIEGLFPESDNKPESIQVRHQPHSYSMGLLAFYSTNSLPKEKLCLRGLRSKFCPC